jgi:hypothetical protein
VSPNREGSERFGAIDPEALYRIREVFWRQEPLVETAEIDSPARPSTLSVTLDGGFESPGRFDFRRSQHEYYSFHYQESGDGSAFRFDRHPNPHSPEKRFHRPPNAATDAAEPSCIEVVLPDLVALAVLEAWRHALDCDDLSFVNSIENPP